MQLCIIFADPNRTWFRREVSSPSYCVQIGSVYFYVYTQCASISQIRPVPPDPSLTLYVNTRLLIDHVVILAVSIRHRQLPELQSGRALKDCLDLYKDTCPTVVQDEPNVTLLFRIPSQQADQCTSSTIFPGRSRRLRRRLHPPF